jgi:hypothetical protein
MTEDRDGAPTPSDAAPDEDELRTKRAYGETMGSDEELKKSEEDIDEAVEESFPASDPPSYSKGLPTTG